MTEKVLATHVILPSEAILHVEGSRAEVIAMTRNNTGPDYPALVRVGTIGAYRRTRLWLGPMLAASCIIGDDHIVDVEADSNPALKGQDLPSGLVVEL